LKPVTDVLLNNSRKADADGYLTALKPVMEFEGVCFLRFVSGRQPLPEHSTLKQTRPGYPIFAAVCGRFQSYFFKHYRI
jgi:hypothetical protein